MLERPQTPVLPAHRFGRVAALGLGLIALVFGLGASVIEYSFSSDPLGPRFFPLALAIILGLLSVWYFVKPGPVEEFPTGPLLWRVLGIPATLVVSALLFEPLGFVGSILVLTFMTAILFEASVKKALIGAVGHAALWWFVFSFALQVYLPAGALFGG